MLAVRVQALFMWVYQIRWTSNCFQQSNRFIMIGSEIRLATFLRIAHPSFTYLYTSPYSTYSVYILAVHKLLFNQLLGYRSSPRRNIYPYHRRPLSMIIVFIHRIYLFENTIIHMYLNIRGNMTKTQIKRLTWTV